MKLTVQILSSLVFAGFTYSLKNNLLTPDDKAFEASAAGKYAYSGSKVHGIAVFILGTMRDAEQFGERVTSTQMYYDRAVASRMTWARQAETFYIVTGSGGPEDRVLKNTSYCRFMTDHTRAALKDHHLKPLSYELLKCGSGQEEINVLHLPHCLGSYAGADGPCCRCEGALLFYSALHKSHVTRGHKFANWVMFSDDDYFVRLNYLQSILDTPALPHDKEYALVPSSDFEVMPTGHGHNSTERPKMGLFRQGVCRSSCMFRVPWMSWGGFSIGAVRRFEDTLAQGGLVRVCAGWGVTHDIGLGLYTWMHSTEVVDIKMYGDSGHPPDGKGYDDTVVLWHKGFTKGMKYDTLFELIWKKGKLNESLPFYADTYDENEKILGMRYHEKNHMFPNGGFKNTVFYRNMTYRNAILTQLHESQQGNFTIQTILDYVPKDCTADRDLFLDWKRKRNPGKEVKVYVDDEAHGVNTNIPKECLEYSMYINNLHVALPEEDQLPIDELIR